MDSLRRAYLCVAYFVALLIFAVGSLVVNAFCFVVRLIAPLRPGLVPVARRGVQAIFSGWKYALGFAGILYLDSLPQRSIEQASGEIYVSNHPSIMDATYLFQFIPNATCIYKHDIDLNPFYGSTARILGLIPNLGGAHIVRSACRALERGENLVVFPEGTRSTEVEPDNFKPGFALIAKRSQALIRLINIDSPDDFMVKERPIWRVPRLPVRVVVREIGTVDPAAYDSVDSIMEAVRAHYQPRAAA